MISRIRIQNFRSLIDVTVDLAPLTVLIGRSGTGKSNFVAAVRALRDVLDTSNQDALITSAPLGRHEAYPAFEVDLSADVLDGPCHYAIKFSLLLGTLSPAEESLSCGGHIIFAQKQRSWVKEPNVTPLPWFSPPLLSSLSGLREVVIVSNLLGRSIGCYDFPGNVLQNPQDVRPESGYWDNGQNSLPIVGVITDDIRRIEDWNSLTDTIASLNPAVRSVAIARPKRNEIRVGYQVGANILSINVSAESEGFRRYLATLLALYQTPAKQTLIFEHPENGIHPGALETLANEFKRHVRQGRGQIILTTHSPQLLDHFEPEQIRVVDIENQQTKIGPLAHEQIEALREKLLKPGELLTVDPARLEGQLAEVPA